MDNFKIIYKILKILEKAMDVEEFDHGRTVGRKWSIVQRKLERS